MTERESVAARAAASLISEHDLSGRPSTAMSTTRARPRAKMQSFMDSKQAYEEARETATNKNYSPKYDSRKFNILKGIQDERRVTQETLKRCTSSGSGGLDGLKR